MGVNVVFAVGIFTAFFFISNRSPSNSGLVNAIQVCQEKLYVCKRTSQCKAIFDNLQYMENPPFCDYKNKSVCCPLPVEHTPPDLTNPWTKECKKYQEIIGGDPRTALILDGTEAKRGEFPFMALIGYKDKNGETSWKCGGTLITPNVVLTATHCINSVGNLTLVVRLGELDYSTADNDTQEFDALSLIMYSSFDSYEHRGDIGLIKLKGNATLNSFVLPACLPTQKNDEYVTFEAAGWGQTSMGGQASTKLLKVKLYQNPNCSQFFSENLDHKICAGSVKDHADTCLGDSGGPLFRPHPSITGMYEVVGITAHGLGCGEVEDDVHFPSIYTRVYSFMKWLTLHVEI